MPQFDSINDFFDWILQQILGNVDTGSKG